MASMTRKYATLPDLDSAPDIYETPELVDDLSTLQTSTARSSSPASSDADGQENYDQTRNISHQHLHPDQARSYFSPARVDARDVDFSDRVDSRRRSYRTSTSRYRRRRLRRVEGGEEHRTGDVNEEEDDEIDEDDEEYDEEEGVRRRIARLKREVEEVKEVFGRKEMQRKDGDDNKEAQQRGFNALVDLIAKLKKMPTGSGNAGAELQRQLARKMVLNDQASSPSPSINPPGPTPLSNADPSFPSTSSTALERATILESRLTNLETLLGLTSPSATSPTFTPHQLPNPLLPTLTHLHRQIAIIARALATPNPLPTHITTLLDRLQSLPAHARPQQASSETQKIEQIFPHLSTLDNLTPLLPPLLNRLESLHQIHMRAGGAEKSLEEAELIQAQMGRDIEMWKKGLEKVEEKMVRNEELMKGNVGVVEGWVKALEERVQKLDDGGSGEDEPEEY